jgi:hypothetical protein
MSRSCVCGGSNENCRYCGGLGTIDDGLAVALIDHAQHIDLYRRYPVYRQGRPRPELVKCPEPGCFARLTPRLQNHLKKIHMRGRPIPFSVQPPPVLNAPEEPLQERPKSVPQLVPCPISGCSAKLNPNRVARHMLKAHREVLQARVNKNASHITNEKTHTSKVAREIVVNSIPDGTPRVSSYAQAPEKNLDATKGHAHAYRESGRFGSHPSHDGFDGESCPD